MSSPVIIYIKGAINSHCLTGVSLTRAINPVLKTFPMKESLVSVTKPYHPRLLSCLTTENYTESFWYNNNVLKQVHYNKPSSWHGQRRAIK